MRLVVNVTPAKQQVLKYWESKCRGDEIPIYGDFDLLDLADYLPSIVLFKVERDPYDLVYKMVGSNVDRHNTEPFTGRHMSELEGKGPDSFVFQFFKSVCEKKEKAEREMPYVGSYKEFKNIEILALPIADEDEEVGYIVVVTDYFPK